MIQTKENYNVYMNFIPTVEQLVIIVLMLTEYKDDGFVSYGTIQSAEREGIEINVNKGVFTLTEVSK